MKLKTEKSQAIKNQTGKKKNYSYLHNGNPYALPRA
jgi:hypothetical protein